MTDDPVKIFEVVLNRAKFAERVSNELCHVRHIEESDFQTLERIIKLAQKITCDNCRGYGRTIVGTCRICGGTGERAYDPTWEKTVRKIMEE